MLAEYTVNGKRIEVTVEGDVAYGADRVLLDEDDDLTRTTSWRGAGYTVAPFLEPGERRALVGGLARRCRRAFRELGFEADEDLRLEDYHKTVGATEEAHAAVVGAIRHGYPIDELPVDVSALERWVGEQCGAPVTSRNERHGIRTYHLRIVRPGSGDNNPLHRDVWLDRLRDAVNIYFPVAGSTDRSSLCLVPGSHRWKESDICRTLEGATVDGSRYTVPAVVGARAPLDLVRPNPSPDEALLFSPYLIHGGAVNLNDDATRVSLEMRFWRRP